MAETTPRTREQEAFFQEFGREPTINDIGEFNRISAELVQQTDVPEIQNAQDLQQQAPEIKLPQVQEQTAIPTGAALADQIRQQTEALFRPSEEQTQLEQQGSALQREILEGVKALGGQRAEQQRLQEQEGVTQLTQDLTNLASQVQALDLSSSAQQIEIAGQEGGISKGIVQGQLNRAQRDKAVKSLQLAAQASVLQGNLSLAQQRVQQALEVKYEPIKQELTLLQTAIEFNRDNLSRADQKRADQLQIALRERERVLEQQQRRDEQINQIMLESAKQGAGAEVLDAIRNSSTVAEAISNSGDALRIKEQPNWMRIADGDGYAVIFDQNTGITKRIEFEKQFAPTPQGTVVEVAGPPRGEFFTDASGVSWNISGWATDPTKAQQMQRISDQIGKVTEENIAQKVQQFTPGLTPEMIKETSRRTGVSWEALMAMVKQEALGGLSNVAKKNNNFGGLTWNNQEWIKEFGGTKGTARPAAEGGNYIAFPSKQDGLNAMGALMASYGTVTPPEAQPVDSEVSAYVDLIKTGQTTFDKAIDDISKEKAGDLAIEWSKTPTPEDTEKVASLKERLTLLDELEAHPGFNSSVGPTPLTRTSVIDQFGAKDSFIGDVQFLTSQETLQELLDLKRGGGTLGALSDSERIMLKQAATKIGGWEVRSMFDDEKVVGYDIDEKSFKKELDRLRTLARRAIMRTGIPELQEMDDGSMWRDNGDGTFTQVKSTTSSISTM